MSAEKVQVEKLLDLALEKTFEVPAGDHTTFVNFMRNSVLTVDCWDADSQVNYGFARVPLCKLLRQGEPSRVLAQEIDILEPNQNGWVGSLQMLIANEGKRESDIYSGKTEQYETAHTTPEPNSLFTPISHKKSKKVYSTPLSRHEAD